MTGEFSANIVKILAWANDPGIQQSNIATVLLTEGLHDLNDLVVQNPHSSKLHVPLPDEQEMLDYINLLAETQFTNLAQQSEVSLDVLAARLVGLSRIGARTAIALAVKNGKKLTSQWLMKDAQGTHRGGMPGPAGIRGVALHAGQRCGDGRGQGLAAAGRGVAQERARSRAADGLPGLRAHWHGQDVFGDLLGGRVESLRRAQEFPRQMGGEADRFNLEKIFAILHALGQVVVFVDEADQAAGKRDSGGDDGGLSGRVYGMLAKEMSDTQNRGKILWVFATSRPDLLEVDLKCQGRLDVHVPLFGPQSSQEVCTLLLSVAGKLKLAIAESDLPDLGQGLLLGGNELEGILSRGAHAGVAGNRQQEVAQGSPGRCLPRRAAQRQFAQAGVHGPGGREGVHRLAVPAQAVPGHGAEDLERRIDELRRFM